MREETPEASTARSTAAAPQPAPPARTSRASGWSTGDAGERAHQRGQVLARFERAHEQQIRATRGQPVVHDGQVGGVRPGLGLVRPEPSCVDPVRGYEHLGLHRAPSDQLLGGDPARADHGGGPAGGHPDGPAEQQDLRPLVPVGLLEEAQVVDGDHGGHRRSLGHGVVGPVVHVDGPSGQQRGEPDLLPGQAEQAGLGRPGLQLAERNRGAPAGLVGAPAEQHHIDVGSGGQGPGQLHGVLAGADRPGRHGGHIEREPQAGVSHGETGRLTPAPRSRP